MFNGRFSIDDGDDGARDNQELHNGIPSNFAGSGENSGGAHEGGIRL